MKNIKKYNLSVSPGSTKNNKTGGWRTFKPVFDHKKCIGCGNCARVCPEGVCFVVGNNTPPACAGRLTPLERGTGNNTPSSTSSGQALTSLPAKDGASKRGHGISQYYECDLDYCKGCGLCAKECPAGAIRMEREGK